MWQIKPLLPLKNLPVACYNSHDFAISGSEEKRNFRRYYRRNSMFAKAAAASVFSELSRSWSEIRMTTVSAIVRRFTSHHCTDIWLAVHCMTTQCNATSRSIVSSHPCFATAIGGAASNLKNGLFSLV